MLLCIGVDVAQVAFTLRELRAKRFLPLAMLCRQFLKAFCRGLPLSVPLLTGQFLLEQQFLCDCALALSQSPQALLKFLPALHSRPLNVNTQVALVRKRRVLRLAQGVLARGNLRAQWPFALHN